MWTQSSEGRAFIQDLSRLIVADQSPDESELFEEFAEQYFSETPPARKKKSEDPLAFGLEAFIPSTPAILAMVTAALSFIASEVLKAAKDEAGEQIKNKIKSLFASGDKAPPLTPTQLEQIQKVAMKRGVDCGLLPGQAATLAHAIIGTLAIRK